jgi:nickel superoxide dismutase
MKKTCLLILVGFSFLLFAPSNGYPHCEIPCGIYDDEMRISMIKEHVATIEKAMNQILKMEKEGKHNYNQLIRWVMNKERHAEELQEIVTRYFMTQRIKPEMENYEKKLEVLQQMLIYSMKCKQTTDVNHTNRLRSFLKDFQTLYFEKK